MVCSGTTDLGLVILAVQTGPLLFGLNLVQKSSWGQVKKTKAKHQRLRV